MAIDTGSKNNLKLFQLKKFILTQLKNFQVKYFLNKVFFPLIMRIETCFP